MTPLLVAATAGFSAVLLVVGWTRARRDPLSEIAAEDLQIVNQQGKRSLGNSPKSTLGGPLGRLIQRTIGGRGVAEVDGLIGRAGRPEGKSTKAFFDEVGYYTLITGTLGIVSFVIGLPLLLCFLLFGLGFFAPFYVLWATAAERQATIDRDLPDFLDVLAVVVSAGLGFQQALDRVSQRYGGPLGAEMQHALNGMTVGEGFRESLGGVRERTRSESVDQFVTALLQAEELGSPLTQSLNQIAIDVRRDSSETEKRRAAKAAPQATIVTILILMPPTLAIMVYGMVVAIRG